MLIMFATALSICGAGAVALHKPFPANILWTISNPILIYHNYVLGEFEQASMFSIFAIISLFGIINGVRKHDASK